MALRFAALGSLALALPTLTWPRCDALDGVRDERLGSARDPASLPSRTPAPSPPRTPEQPSPRVTTSPPPVPPRRVLQLPEAVVVRALDAARPAFVRCFERARTLDPTLGHLKVTLHADVDIDGVVLAARTDVAGELPRLDRCLVAVTRGILFAAPGEAAVVDVPLMD